MRSSLVFHIRFVFRSSDTVGGRERCSPPYPGHSFRFRGILSRSNDRNRFGWVIDRGHGWWMAHKFLFVDI